MKGQRSSSQPGYGELPRERKKDKPRKRTMQEPSSGPLGSSSPQSSKAGKRSGEVTKRMKLDDFLTKKRGKKPMETQNSGPDTGQPVHTPRSTRAVSNDRAPSQDLVASKQPESRREDARQQNKKALYDFFIQAIQPMVKSSRIIINKSYTMESFCKELSNRLEHCLNNDGKTELNTYARRSRTILHNLGKNPELRELFLDGVVSPERLAVMTSEELASQKLQVERQQQRERAASSYTIVKDLQQPRIRKGHEGDEVVKDPYRGSAVQPVNNRPSSQKRTSTVSAEPEQVPPSIPRESPRAQADKRLEIPEIKKTVSKGSSGDPNFQDQRGDLGFAQPGPDKRIKRGVYQDVLADYARRQRADKLRLEEPVGAGNSENVNRPEYSPPPLFRRSSRSLTESSADSELGPPSYLPSEGLPEDGENILPFSSPSASNESQDHSAEEAVSPVVRVDNESGAPPGGAPPSALADHREQPMNKIAEAAKTADCKRFLIDAHELHDESQPRKFLPANNSGPLTHPQNTQGPRPKIEHLRNEPHQEIPNRLGEIHPFPNQAQHGIPAGANLDANNSTIMGDRHGKPPNSMATSMGRDNSYPVPSHEPLGYQYMNQNNHHNGQHFNPNHRGPAIGYSGQQLPRYQGPGGYHNAQNQYNPLNGQQVNLYQQSGQHFGPNPGASAVGYNGLIHVPIHDHFQQPGGYHHTSQNQQHGQYSGSHPGTPVPGYNGLVHAPYQQPLGQNHTNQSFQHGDQTFGINPGPPVMGYNRPAPAPYHQLGGYHHVTQNQQLGFQHFCPDHRAPVVGYNGPVLSPYQQAGIYNYTSPNIHQSGEYYNLNPGASAVGYNNPHLTSYQGPGGYLHASNIQQSGAGRWPVVQNGSADNHHGALSGGPTNQGRFISSGFQRSSGVRVGETFSENIHPISQGEVGGSAHHHQYNLSGSDLPADQRAHSRSYIWDDGTSASAGSGQDPQKP